MYVLFLSPKKGAMQYNLSYSDTKHNEIELHMESEGKRYKLMDKTQTKQKQ